MRLTLKNSQRETDLVSRVIEFDVLGVPVAKGRARITTRGKFPHAYTPQKTRDAEATLAARSLAFRPKRPLVGPLTLTAMFVLPIPASWSRKRKAAPPRHTSKPDLDNLVKLLKDALNGVFWLDDRQIYSVLASKSYGEIPFTRITIAESDDREGEK